eukprot:12886979-Prorocentrum_lima.AAC.1
MRAYYGERSTAAEANSEDNLSCPRQPTAGSGRLMIHYHLVMKSIVYHYHLVMMSIMTQLPPGDE